MLRYELLRRRSFSLRLRSSLNGLTSRLASELLVRIVSILVQVVQIIRVCHSFTPFSTRHSVNFDSSITELLLDGDVSKRGRLRQQLCKGFARVRTERDAIEVELFEAVVFEVVDGVDQFNELLSPQLAVVHVDDLQIFLLADEVENALIPIFIREPGRCVAQIQLVQVEHFEVDQVSQDGLHVLVLIIGHVGGPEAFEFVRGLQIHDNVGKRFHEERLGLIV